MLLDGGMGALLQKKNLKEDDFHCDMFKDVSAPLKGNYDLLTISNPEIIKSVHREYLLAGSDIIETCSFNSNKFSQLDYGTEKFVYELNFNAAKIAKEECEQYSTPDKPRFVAGSIGPTNQAAGIASNADNPAFRKYYFDDFSEAFYEQIRGLADGGADILLVETVFDPINGKAALYAANEYFKNSGKSLPIFLSITLDANGRLLNGQSLEAFYYAIADIPNIFAVGLNCSLGAKQMRPFVKNLSEIAEFYTVIYPNAGLPNEFGGYDESSESMAIIMNDYAQEGFINLLGGCCGTTPKHIRAFSSIPNNCKPREIPESAEYLRLSGFETLKITVDSNFINIGERTNVSGSRIFLNTIAKSDYEGATKIALNQIENGATVIDINVDEALLDGEKTIRDFLCYLMSEHNASKVPIMLDSSKWETLLSGLKCLSGKGIVNSISLKDGEKAFIEKAEKIKQFGCAILIMAFDEEGQATSFERKIEILSRAYKILTEEVEIKPHNIIFDPNILAIGTGIDEHSDYANAYLKIVKWLKEHFPKSYISGGVSNLSFSFRGNDFLRESIHSVFLYYAISAGMDMGIVNAGKLIIYDNIESDLKDAIENLIFNKVKHSEEKLIEISEKFKNQKGSEENFVETWREAPALDRIKYALVNGTMDYLDTDVEEARQLFQNPLDLIEGPFMDAMNKVGELFGSGKMFLPQVVKSARAMKKAVSFLEPYINANKSEIHSKGKILMATVKGDVHDIGKNIVGLVLACNGFEIIDLGIMVSDEKIIEQAKALKVDAIGLSGLITPSLEEMAKVASEMEKNNFTIPLLIGGATTSKLHTAVKISERYSGDVIHAVDASQGANIVNTIFNKELKTNF